MKRLFANVMALVFGEISGTRALDASIDKFRELRDSYRKANREYYGEYLFSILEER